MTQTEPTSYLRDGVPDWDAIDFDVTCVRCGYNLKMLDQPRCPECGLEFEWLRVINYHHQTSDFLFEHQWRHKPVRSFVTTVRRAFAPARFWSSVSMFERVRAGPLLVLVMVSVLIFLIVLHAVAWLGGKAILAVVVPAAKRGQYFTSPGRLEEMGLSLEVIGELPFLVDLAEYLLIPGCVLAAVLGALGLVLLLGDTLGRCRVRRVQVLRVFAYALLPTAFVQPLVTLAFQVVSQLGSELFPSPPPIWAVLFLSLASMVIVVSALGVYLSLGFKHYLRIPQPWAVGMTASFVGVLAVAAMIASTIWFR